MIEQVRVPAMRESTWLEEQEQALPDRRGQRPTIAFLDDHAMLRGALGALVAATRPNLEVVYSGDDLAAVQQLPNVPDVLLLDLNLHGEPPPPAIVADLASQGCAIIVLSAIEDRQVVRTMVGLGVSGFVSKEEEHGALLTAIDAALADEPVMNSEVALALCPGTGHGEPSLSEQEQRVLVLFGSGLKICTVGRRLNISPNTVKTHLKRIRQKYVDFGRPIPTQSHVQLEALRRGLIAV